MYPSTQNAVCFERLKSAALYFDSVIPVAFHSLQGRGEEIDVMLKLPEEIPGDALVNLVFGVTPASNREKWTLLGRYIDTWTAFQKAIRPALGGLSDASYDDVKVAYLQDSVIGSNSSVRSEFVKLAETLGKQYSTVLVPNRAEVDGQNAYACLVLSNIPLVDTARMSWEQVLDLRKDPEARAALRNLRLFFYSNYNGKPSSFVADDLARRLDEYSSTRKRMGFESITGSISDLIEAKSVHSAAAMGLAAGLAGGPLIGLTSAALLEVSGMALEFAKRRFAITEFEKHHDLAYLIQAQKKGD
ncbi:hypothetical protein [Pseudomonas sp. nanlin1]|uniref:hypothetical protein n=1 Tax=Pseudomonas sp. nanlin1 TaxID=3040605 RepID=UPI00388FE981